MKSPLIWVMHGHMPWVKGGQGEERWLWEAIAECYWPLLRVLDNAPAATHLCVSISPPLLRQWGSIDDGLIAGFGRLAETGKVTLFTTAATHGYLPLLHGLPGAVDLQLEAARDIFERCFGRLPQGLWLPECGYQAGLDADIAAHGFRFAFVEDHAFIGAKPELTKGIRAPARTPAGLTLFPRDSAVCARVWSREHGYPAHADYLDFYKRRNGQRWARVGGGEWNGAVARERARLDAVDFVKRLEADCRQAPGLRVLAFDMELFGHWWFEGPCFVAEVLKQVAQSREVEWCAPADFDAAALEMATLTLSSWGRGGYSEVWMNERNAWLWPPLTRVTEKLDAVLRSDMARTPLEDRGLRQAQAQVLLAQASDWPFLLDAQTSVDVATRRLRTHLEQAEQLLNQLATRSVDASLVAALEARDPLLSQLS
ncbi:MAG: DUF1957 domain-containing protein [Myxococcaceae bacterium]|nr:DUF1957 domain-containing protein [Myxococcaceae bacterium]